ncbi:hypothetical protein GCM10012286_63010 [Streptomyces lasiicapitis]|uniref:Uncharacterized protein n=2 Tax=Streptomyces lasiicapitis TaxID=1923961 RepID=A0ABQ2MK92_9ACTN|nr:hypothetical protein GCM10012286_63010 [Streptomyces lasiicapitis]
MTNGHELVRVIGGGDFLSGRRLSLGLELTEDAVAKYRMYYFDLDAYTLNGGGPMPSWEGSVVGGVLGRITHVTVGGGASGEVAVGHVTLANRQSAYANTGSAMIGWQGEAAHSRIQRLAREEQIPLAYKGNSTATPTKIGAQAVASLLDLMQDAADTDEGRLYEPRDLLGLAFRTRASHYTQPAALTLDYTAREVVAPLEPVDDDQAVRNDITVQRSGGSFARAVCESGPLSVQAPPRGIGRYAEQVTTNLATDDQCTPVAWWRLHRGTWDAARYPAVTVALHEAPHLAGPASAVDVGHRIAMTNPPPWLPPERVELLVEGYTETLGVRTWELAFSCAPGGPWLVATSDHAEYATAGPDDCTLAAPLDAHATTPEVITTAGPPWPLSSRNPDLYPITVRIGGERLTITAVQSAPGGGAGNSPSAEPTTALPSHIERAPPCSSPGSRSLRYRWGPTGSPHRPPHQSDPKHQLDGYRTS